MLTAFESKVVISTLTKRRSWLKKTLADTNLDPEVRKEHADTLAALDTGMKKLAALAPKAAASSTTQKSKSPLVSKPAPKLNLSMDTLRILVAEDQEETLEIMTTILTDMGVKQVDEAKDGRDAFDKIKAADEPYHLILCDWDMPELSGLEVHRKATASNTLGYAKFWMVTGISESKKIREAVQQGVHDYVVKPIEPDTLESKLKALIAESCEA